MAPKPEASYDPQSSVKSNPDEDIVVSGFAGRFPNSDDMYKFRDNLMNSIDLVTEEHGRWQFDHPELPRRMGRVNGVDKFDADFFNINFKEAHTMDPMCRMLLEHTFEAILDAGVNPKQLKGTNAGVFIGASFSESEMTWVYEKPELNTNGSGLTGCARSLFAARVSHWLGVTGPSYNVDTACSSSFYAMEHAYSAIRNGLCDSAIVAGVNLCLHPNVALMFSRLGVLSPDGRSKCFDNRANGYVRGETIGVTYLQKSRDAKRIYARIIHAKTNCDGFKPQGITFPSSHVQSLLLKELYEECRIPPSSISYVEAHGTGTSVGDPEELTAILSVLCPGRKDALKIGSVKSSIGHAEPASGMGQLAKVLIAYETGVIPPTLHYTYPREGVEGLVDGRLKVVTEPTKWNGGLVGISSFGFGGANAHILLKSHSKEKINGGAPRDKLPRLVVASGRTEEAVGTIFADLESRPVDAEFIRLFHDIYAHNITGHHYRGYTILNAASKGHHIVQYPGSKRPVWFVFSGIGSQWPSMGTSLLRFPVFANAIKKCDKVLKPCGIDIQNILTNSSESMFEHLSNIFVGIAAVQIGLVDLLVSLGIVPHGIMGYSFGELGCAYADGCLTAEQVVMSAYQIALALMETSKSASVSAVGISNGDLKNVYPQQAGPKLLKYLKNIITEPKPRSDKWISTSIPKSQWHSAAARFSSPEYHTNNLLSPVLFKEVASAIPSNAVIIEISPHGLLQSVLKDLNPTAISIVLSQHEQRNNEVFLHGIGKLYEAGLELELAKLYPNVEFPVSRTTPMISPLIKWNHTEDWFVSTHKMTVKITSGERVLKLSLTDDTYEYMEGHMIDGRNLLPATGYLTLIWETVGMMMGEPYSEVPIVFEDIKFLRATTVSHDISLSITCVIQKGTGDFEVIEGGVAVVTGRVRHTSNPQEEQITFPIPSDDEPEDMTSRDVYKELRLRGYQYSGFFKAIKSATVTGSKGTITWAHNWVAFMDNMLQMQILGRDTRSLLVPTRIRKLTIDTKKHSQQIRAMPYDKQEFKVYSSKKYDVIRAGGIEIRGLHASAISRRKPAGDPVLETYEFIAHREPSELPLNKLIRVAVHLVLENHFGIQVKTLESLEPQEKCPRNELLSPYIADTLADLPMVQADVNIVASENPSDEDLSQNVKIIDPRKLNAGTNALILAGRDLLTAQKSETLRNLMATVKENPFIITLESSPPEEFSSSAEKRGFHIIFERKYRSSRFLLLKKIQKLPKNNIVIQVNNNEFTWVNDLKAALKEATEEEASRSSRILVISDKTFENGLLGLVNCLRKEPGGELVRGVLIQDSKAPRFDLSERLYADQMKLDLAVNVLRVGGIWGSYRHLALPAAAPRPSHHAWMSQLIRSDLTSFRWVDGPLTASTDKSRLIHVYYSSMNFKDVMLATGKLIIDDHIKSRKAVECALGFEYAGVTADGRRVMGMVSCRAMTNLLIYDPYLTWTVPDSWNLEDAASVPCVYGTACYALYVFGRMERGDKVLIHAGSGGVGQAAINLALWTGCEIFTTVGTEEKRLFIRKAFPQIPDDHIGNSRDTSFEQMIMNKTNGKGVDIVLNSLAEEKLQASIRCLAEGGRFLEIGKFDMANDSQLGMSVFMKGTSFYSVLLDRLVEGLNDKEKQKGFHELMQKALDQGAIKPLNVTIFSRDQVELAFRHMAAGKHIGKVILKIQDGNDVGSPIPAFPRYYCRGDCSYLILGGLGGFGLELADWLVLRGAQNLILTSRSGIKNGYQRMRIKIWESYGVKVTIISGKESSNPTDCKEILSIASKQAPVDAIYNLAVILKDSIWENQTPESFEESFKGKAWSTKNLDEISRKLCPKLRHFVVFSSVSCGRGNAGQTNYGMSNSVMERICEKRAAEGLPALAIQWGAVGDVGLVADMQDDDKELVIGGTLQQKITSCLHELDGFLNQNSPVVASMVVAEKRAGGSGALNLVDTVLNIMGFKDLSSIGQHTPLAELGMDSMMAVEIRQTLEREFEIFLTAQDIRGINFAKLVEMNSKSSDQNSKHGEEGEGEVLTGLKLLMRLVGTGEAMKDVCLKLPTMGEEGRKEIFLIPGIEGCGSIFMNLAERIKAPATCLQLSNTNPQYVSIEKMADKLSLHVLERSQNRKDFVIVGYSYGSTIAIELVRRLEAEGLTGKIILIDGSPEFMKMIKNQQLTAKNDDELETNVLLGITDIAAPALTKDLGGELEKCKSWNKKLDVFIDRVGSDALGISVQQRKKICTCIYNRLKAVDDYDISRLPPLRSSIILLKPTVETLKGLPDDYGLSKVTGGKIECHTIDGDHITILENSKITSIINEEPITDE